MAPRRTVLVGVLTIAVLGTLSLLGTSSPSSSSSSPPSPSRLFQAPDVQEKAASLHGQHRAGKSHAAETLQVALAAVVCGERLEQALVLLRSALMLAR